MTLLRPDHAARTRLLTTLVALVLVLPLLFAGGLPTASAHGGALDAHGDETDPARNVPLLCEQVPTPGTPGRAARNIVHVANVCGTVGTDVEFQSREDSAGRIHNYAFVGTMGAGMRIYDVTNPATPIRAGGYVDTGWQNDV